MGTQGVGQRHHPSIEGAARCAQSLARFKDDRELDKIKPSHIDQRTCPLSSAISIAWAKASRLSRSLTRLNGGGRSMGSDMKARVRMVGVSGLPFLSCKHNYTRRTVSARVRSLLFRAS